MASSTSRIISNTNANKAEQTGPKERTLRKIQSYIRTSKRHPNDANTRYVIANAFQELSKLESEKKKEGEEVKVKAETEKETIAEFYSQQALAYFNDAVRIASENPSLLQDSALYLKARAMYYYDTKQYDLAKADILKVIELPDHYNVVFDMDIKNGVRKLYQGLKLDLILPSKFGIFSKDSYNTATSGLDENKPYIPNSQLNI